MITIIDYPVTRVDMERTITLLFNKLSYKKRKIILDNIKMDDFKFLLLSFTQTQLLHKPPLYLDPPTELTLHLVILEELEKGFYMFVDKYIHEKNVITTYSSLE